jgi:hypothetical protein
MTTCSSAGATKRTSADLDGDRLSGRQGLVEVHASPVHLLRLTRPDTRLARTNPNSL